MDWMMELDLMRFFREDKKERRDMDDRYLQDFSSAWRGLPHDGTGVAGGYVSQQDYLAYLKAMKEDNPAQGQYNLEESGLAFYIDPDTGHAVFQGAGGSMVIHKNNFAKVIQGFQGKKPPDTVNPPGNPPNQASYDDRPEIKRRMEQNLKNLEKWAVASSKTFPK